MKNTTLGVHLSLAGDSSTKIESDCKAANNQYGGLGNGNWKTRRETFKFSDLVAPYIRSLTVHFGYISPASLTEIGLTVLQLDELAFQLYVHTICD